MSTGYSQEGNRNMTQIPTVGTVIHGTLVTHDLLVAFADVLELYGEDHPEHIDLSREAREISVALDKPVVEIATMERANDVLNDLFDALHDIASKHDLNFGAHEGDGSDFGFWPNEEDTIQ
jgi:hypothetical protein